MSLPDDPGIFDDAEEIDIRPLHAAALFCVGMVVEMLVASLF